MTTTTQYLISNTPSTTLPIAYAGAVVQVPAQQIACTCTEGYWPQEAHPECRYCAGTGQVTVLLDGAEHYTDEHIAAIHHWLDAIHGANRA